MYVSFTVVALTNIIAPKPVIPQYMGALISRYGLDKKYGEVASHIDRIFWRYIHPVSNKMQPVITGSQIRGALKEALGLGGKPLKTPFKIVGVFFNEEDVTVEIRYVTMQNGRQTLRINEIVIAGSKGELLILTPRDDLPLFNRLPGLTINVGAEKSKGMGLIKGLSRGRTERVGSYAHVYSGER